MSGVSGVAGSPAGVELVGHHAGEAELAARIGIRIDVQLDAANLAAKREGVLRAHPGPCVGEAQRLVAHARRNRIVETGEARRIGFPADHNRWDRWRCR